MAIDYSGIAEGAHAAILDAGGPVTLIQPGSTEYIPGQGMVTQPDIEHPCTGVIFDFGLSNAGMNFTAGTLIEAGDRWLIVSPDSVPAAFAPGWRAAAFGESYTVAAVKVTAPAGIPVLYEALVRK